MTNSIKLAARDDQGLGAHVLRHMAVETSVLLDEVQVAAACQLVRGPEAQAQAIETVATLCYRLTQISAWLSERIAWQGTPSDAGRDEGLGPRRNCRPPEGDKALTALVGKVDRLFERAARLDTLTRDGDIVEAPRAPIGGPVAAKQSKLRLAYSAG